MDACFLTSRSISGVKDLVPFIKAKILSCPKRNSGQFPRRKLAYPITLNCSVSDSWKPVEDVSKDSSDWREFRAKLVAGEGAETGSKWAHKIYEPETGCLLIATEKLDGVHIFERTVILLLSVGPSGPIGVILNRPSLMSIKETKSRVSDMAGTFSDKRLFFGGPLEEGLFLVSSGVNEVGKSGVFRQVMEGLYYGTRETLGLAAEMVKRNLVGTSEIRFFDGYCGWEKEQLKAEILGGYWTVAASSSSLVQLGSSAQIHSLRDDLLALIGPQTGSLI